MDIVQDCPEPLTLCTATATAPLTLPLPLQKPKLALDGSNVSGVAVWSASCERGPALWWLTRR